MPTLLVRYGEIGLKSASVRRRFENTLVDDIRRRHALAKVPCVITSTRGRLFVDSDDWRKSCEILTRTFGIVSFSPVERVESDLDSLTRSVLNYAEPLLFKNATFAIRPRRTGNHSYTSQTMAEHLGSAVLAKFKDRVIKVSLGQPDVEIFVEVRDKAAYLFSSTLLGPGGMPLGTQGRALSVIDSENGLASTWLMMKRGCSILAAVRERSIVRPLEKWCTNLRTVDGGDDVFSQAKENDCIGVVLSYALKDIEKKGAPKGDLPVFYPLVGMKEEEISGLLDRIKG